MRKIYALRGFFLLHSTFLAVKKKKSPVKSYETKSNLIESPRSSYSIINKSNTIGASETRPLVLL